MLKTKKPELRGNVGWQKTQGTDVSLYRVTLSSKVFAA